MVDYDVVVVGGGIAGSALAASLAPAGLSVLVLERLTEFRDRVRGEFMHPWGAAEMDRLDLTATLVAAGGNHNPSIVISTLRSRQAEQQHRYQDGRASAPSRRQAEQQHRYPSDEAAHELVAGHVGAARRWRPRCRCRRGRRSVESTSR